VAKKSTGSTPRTDVQIVQAKLSSDDEFKKLSDKYDLLNKNLIQVKNKVCDWLVLMFLSR
jgi:hypothetical protein